MTEMPTELATEASAVELVGSRRTELCHLLSVRKIVFSDQAQREKLEAHALTQPEESLDRALCDWILGRHDRAQAGLEQHANQPGINALRAICATALGQPRRALETVSQPSTPDESRARLQALARIAHSDEAARKELAEFVQSPGQLEGTGWVPFIRGLLHEFHLDSDAAIHAYNESRELDPSNADNSFHLARLLERQGNEEEALEIYEDYVARHPANVALLMNLGLLYEDIGEWKHAERCFRTVLDHQPDNDRARLFLEDVEASKVMHYDEDQERREDKQNEVLRTPVTDFELSVRSRNCLQKMGIRTLGDLVHKTEAELLSYKNFGETSLTEIQEILNSKGLRLGMDRDELMGTPNAPAGPIDMSDPRNKPISELDLSVRSRRIIEMFKLKTVGDLCQKTEAELMACPNFGQTSLNEIKSKLDEQGLSLKG
ncbi:MAG: RNA polymerase subunit sigma [Planctomycetota bacterium]|nr:MAG: RNA polymerase subunit sigma [Planctomycetota bacterium]